MGEWNNLKDVLQDLSEAQGFMVPASLETFGSKAPPPLNIEEEETEEQYYATEGGELHLGPDIELIQQMLSEVRNKKDQDKDDQSDLDPFCPEFLPNSVKAKLNRNVAISSIKAAQEAKLAAKRPVPKAIIPVMFKRKSQTNTEVSSESVSPLLASPLPGKQNEYSPSKLANKYYNKYLQQSQLKEDFKEEIWSRTKHQINQNEARKEREAEEVGSQEIAPVSNKQYTPGIHAKETYNKYLEKSKINESLVEDIWTIAERKMKEIEAKKKRRTDLANPQEFGENGCVGNIACGFDQVNLPQHRHRLTGDCVVCEVASKHGYVFDEDPTTTL